MNWAEALDKDSGKPFLAGSSSGPDTGGPRSLFAPRRRPAAASHFGRRGGGPLQEFAS